MQTLPNLLASRTPFHFATGCGGCQRSAPTGGAANGIPLNARTPGEDIVLPPIWPEARFTRTDDDTIQYEMHVEDPEVLTQPWAAGYPMQRDDSYQFYEYACNEDNTAVRNFIVTSRYERAQGNKP